jgi:hypothetical protein
MSDDLRCCGTGTCIINAEGLCWCGQKWDGEKMCFPAPVGVPSSSAATLSSADKAVENGGLEPQA